MKIRPFTISSAFLVLVAFSLVVAGCQKEGATGPAGAAGPAGPAGAAGPQGPKGDTGTANVIYSAWLDVPFIPDTVHNGPVIDTVGYSAVINAPKLTSAILTNGEMKVYFNYGTTASPIVFPLPLDYFIFGATISPFFELGRISLIASDDVGTFTAANNQKRFQYRYILIPGGTASGRSAVIDWKNYNEVKTYLGLTD